MISIQAIVQINEGSIASEWLLTKVISVVVPALIASSLLLVQPFFSILIIFLS